MANGPMPQEGAAQGEDVLKEAFAGLMNMADSAEQGAQMLAQAGMPEEAVKMIAQGAQMIKQGLQAAGGQAKAAPMGAQSPEAAGTTAEPVR